MENNTKRRKTRTDRNHFIYELRIEAVGLSYIGITAQTCSTPRKSVLLRFQKHVQRARIENKNWPLCEAIRKYGAEQFDLYILDKVRGKKLAHQTECELIKQMQPKLNLASMKG